MHAWEASRFVANKLDPSETNIIENLFHSILKGSMQRKIEWTVLYVISVVRICYSAYWWSCDKTQHESPAE